MRIVIDLQACQTSGSRNRGIGRYSLALAQAMARQAGSHELWLVLNGLFADTIQPIRKAFVDLIPQERIVVWHAPNPALAYDMSHIWRRRAGEILREQIIAELRPDMVHVASLFEGFTDQALTGVDASGERLNTAVTLYDLIPLVYADPYLENPQIREWYYRKLKALKSSDLLLSISEASRREGLEWLQLPEDRVVNISSAVDARFKQHIYDPHKLAELRQRHGLTRPFVMYTGGIDLRKNIEGLIRAYAALPGTLRKTYQLAIVCSARPEDKERLQQLARQVGLEQDELVMTGFVPDDDLPMLYNDCVLFVFPSWHEGFGLPALEAMACGAPVIGANTSSLPEVIGRADALFDPRDDGAITVKLHQALTDQGFRDELRAHGAQQSRKFSWDASARKALAAFEAYHERANTKEPVIAGIHVPQRKPKLAFVAPLPPTRSGIADYSAELLPELARYYDIELITSQPEVEVDDPWLSANFPVRDWCWFDQHAEKYDRILYQFGNSAFHSHMFDLLVRHPGAVVLHDFFLSGVLRHMELIGEAPGVWTRELYESHGYHALINKFQAEDSNDVAMKYPCNLGVLNRADGIIVHANYSIQLAQQWYGKNAAESWAPIPHLRKVPVAADRRSVRAKLGLGDDDFLVCSFGLLGPTKLNHRLLKVWLDSSMAKDVHCHLVFVGENYGGDYGVELLNTIRESGCGDRITITGFADPALFRTYLAAADAAVQLRTLSRGETSGTVLDCMVHGLVTIVNAHGTMAELPEHALLKLPDAFDDVELREKLLELRQDPERRRALGEKAAEHIRLHHAPDRIALQYYQAIERFAEKEAHARRRRTVAAIARVEAPVGPSEADLIGTASALAAGYRMIGAKKLLIGISASANEEGRHDIPAGTSKEKLVALMTKPPAGYRVELVMATQDGLRYARQLACAMLGLPAWAGEDDMVEIRSGDIYVDSSSLENDADSRSALMDFLLNAGVGIFPTLEQALSHAGVTDCQGDPRPVSVAAMERIA